MRRQSLKSPVDLADAGLIPPEAVAGLEAVAGRYAVAITPAMAELIEPDVVGDPIARQFVPDAAELNTRTDELGDPIGDDRHQAVPGLIYRYPDRVLLKLVPVCAVYCRFCFRRETVGPGEAAVLSPDKLDAALAYIRSEPRIWEVIVSGGDPLVASPRRIAELTAAFAAIPHVKVVRWHTRVPVVAPERVTAELVAALRSPAQAVWIAVHANHPRELTPAARAACAMLIDAGLPLVSQTVLLAGVNDDAMTLDALFRAFIESRIKPYYLHHLDRAPGTAGFRTSIAHGQELMRDLRGRLSGLAQPTYVLDIPGGHGKVPIGPDFIVREGTAGGAGGAETVYRIEDIAGCCHCYTDDGGRQPQSGGDPHMGPVPAKQER